MLAIAVKVDNELAKLAGEIGWYEEQTRRSVGLALQYKLEIGRRLARAKELLPHGEFLSWAQHEFGWTPRHVQNHMALALNAKRVSHLPADASLRMALAAIKEVQGRREEAAPTVEDIQPMKRIHLIGEIEHGTVDRDWLLAEVTRFTEELGSSKIRWKIR